MKKIIVIEATIKITNKPFILYVMEWEKQMKGPFSTLVIFIPRNPKMAWGNVLIW